MSLRPYSDGTEHFASVEVRGGRRRLRASFRVAAPSALRSAWLRSNPDGEPEYRQMRRVDGGRWERWEGSATLRGPCLAYRFVLEDATGSLWHLDQRGLHPLPPRDDASFVYLDQPPPAWLAGTTFYQIFPDRFDRAGGEPGPAQRAAAAGLPLPDASVQLPWGARQPSYRSGGSQAFMGGDLAGIRGRLDYLRDLGVGGLYLTPIFLAGMNHRYDTWDYHAVDPRLGTSQDLAALCRDLHEGGLRIILDGVFNHVGAGHRWFNRRGVFDEPGAWQNRQSPFAEYFYFQRHPDRYESWLGVKELVKLDYRSGRLRDEIYGGAQSVVRRWLRPPYGVDGWRLDVANMLGRSGPVQLNAEVLRGIRQAVKETNEDAFVLGEHFFDATLQMQGDQLDSVQDYHGFYFPLLRWLTGSEPQIPKGLRRRPAVTAAADGAEHLAAALCETRARVPFAQAQALFHQLGSHDTPRIATLFGGDRDRVELAVFLQMVWPGLPCIYYGDEIGLEGGRDPENRRAMEWNDATWDHDLRAWHIQLVGLRRQEPALAGGGVLVLHAAGDCFCFARILADRCLVAALNRGDAEAELDVDVGVLGCRGGEAVDLLASGGAPIAGGKLRLTLEPRSARLLRLEEPS